MPIFIEAEQTYWLKKQKTKNKSKWYNCIKPEIELKQNKEYP